VPETVFTRRIRVVGLVSSVYSRGCSRANGTRRQSESRRNETITQPQQIFLLLAAAVLFVVQAALYLIFRHRHKRSYRETAASSKRTDVKE